MAENQVRDWAKQSDEESSPAAETTDVGTPPPEAWRPLADRELPDAAAPLAEEPSTVAPPVGAPPVEPLRVESDWAHAAPGVLGTELHASQIDDVGALGMPDETTEAATRTTDGHDAPSFLSEVPSSFPLDASAQEPVEAPAPSEIPGTIRETRRESRDAARTPDTIMLVNDVTGDECRIALVRNGRLESFFGERAATATSVGNIYKGRVTNVEPAIQAAFVDFGESQNGFLHVSDLHPRYFPGSDRTETVGRKIPRRDRPPIQEALRRGQEILVQVIKEGLGTKGPTLTSYLSIPGRLLVMMPEMDNVGVSRKVEDESQRRAMRQILDSLDLPQGFGFILRTAGFDRSRTELQRDAAYLTRLWQAMERRMERSGAPCELYTESDLLVRTIRDVVDDSVHTIVVDSESAFDRASLFLEIAFPKDPPKIRFYDGATPIFHAFGVEPQVRSIYAREVPLPSGGALVFDQAEAMVAIDVNSGKSRSARDSETNAYNTNREAVDEICRQLRLRDLGGLVVCDLIDMRQGRHRREIEERFREQLKRDRAKTTVLPVSDFGIVELTRQRMRPSVQKMHFMPCPHCEGLGTVKIPDSTAADALRDVQALLGHPRVHRVEMVCSVKVASVLLSGKRERIYEIERRSGKRVDVRISEALPVDRVDLYGYDERGADVDIARLGMPPAPSLDSLPLEPVEHASEARTGAGASAGEGRRKRRRRRPAPADAASIARAGGFDDLPDVRGDEPSALEEIRAHEAALEKERAAARAAAATEAAKPEPPAAGDAREGADRERRGKRRRGRHGRGGGRDPEATPTAATPTAGSPTVAEVEAPAPVAPEMPAPPAVEARRVHLLAKDLNITSKELLAGLRSLETPERPLDARSHMSLLAPEWVVAALRLFAPQSAPPEAPGPSIASSGASTVDAEQARPAGSDAATRDERAEGGGRRRRRRRGRRGKGAAPGGGRPPVPASGAESPARDGAAGSKSPGRLQGGPSPAAPAGPVQGAPSAQAGGGDGGDGSGGGRRRRRRKRRGRGGQADAGRAPAAGAPGTGEHRPGTPGSSAGAPAGSDSTPGAASAPSAPPVKTQASVPRGLYGRAVRKLAGPVKYDDR